MPNWCFNSVIVTHEDPEMLKRFLNAGNGNSLFSEFVPMPDEVRNTVSPSPDNPELIDKYGYSNWYEWAKANWGTKWDISSGSFSLVDSEVSGSFDTAWSPPIAFYEALTELGFDVDATYTEEAQSFAGRYNSYDGDTVVPLDFEAGNDWIQDIEDPVLKDIVIAQYEEWLEYNTEEVESA